MAKLEVTKYGAEVLRNIAQPVKEINDEIKGIINNMLDTLYASEGIGLAAPQIGISKRIIVVDINPSDPSSKPMVMINPSIVNQEGQIEFEEGCLSVPDVRGNVKRAEKVTVEAIDIDGNKIRVEASDLLARVLQHEIDHLNGKLFIDHLSRIKQQLIKKQLRKIQGESNTNKG